MSSDASPARSPDDQLADDVDDDLGGLFGEEDEADLYGDGDDLGLEGSVQGAGIDGDEAVDVINTMPAEMGLHPAPDPSDGELYLFRVPQFLGFEPTCFDATNFQPPTTDLHSKEAPTVDFSPYKTAMRSIRWRKAPDGSGNLQSNSRILRWSDGSLTLQMANDPGTQYLLPANTLTPPQHNPAKPTPTSTGGTKRKGMQKQQPYNAERDAFTYLAAPSESSALLRVTSKLTTSLQVELSRDASEDAVRRLRERIEQAQQDSPMKDKRNQLEIVNISESPELAKARAELAEKERAKAVRKRENQELKNEERAAGRTTARRGFGVSLNANSLEVDDELGAGTKRRPAGAAKPRQKRAARRGEILSDDEDESWGNRGRTREDEYDAEDDFLAPSDEEEDVEAGDDDDEEEDIDEGIVLESTRGRKRASPAEEQDAEGEPDDDDQGGRQNTKRRRVIDDEEED